jgi:hypothetical protein
MEPTGAAALFGSVAVATADCVFGVAALGWDVDASVAVGVTDGAAVPVDADTGGAGGWLGAAWAVSAASGAKGTEGAEDETGEAAEAAPGACAPEDDDTAEDAAAVAAAADAVDCGSATGVACCVAACPRPALCGGDCVTDETASVPALEGGVAACDAVAVDDDDDAADAAVWTDAVC